ncbi:dTDP-4-dehydrorhamnose reductase [Vallitalea guaymasensis]|uniref:dTDP-4-dehydrorhamnose reductase n=1 Tax=Vallitalea guaymasensis TaxID=1185412 RepID=A0A8J8SEM5_9FIRM|nr:dTDP-4-dehydrorhamnose reductase [Vallitalea guaymasensis]QUH32032.1 dTDP-4-dehydrorhamnose reductase [Vallitalea guaymasensis]
MNILITGVNGQLGYDAEKLLSPFHKIVGLNKEELDITKLKDVQNIISNVKPQVIINCAAYTNVDRCEDNIDLAYNINAYGCCNLAILSKKYDYRLVHISTDYIFDGKKNQPYIESDKANPLNIYGSSKLLGENFIKSLCPKHYILRTSWLYGQHGNNFVKTMLKLSMKNDTLNVVNDQIGTPTYTLDLLKVITMVIKTDNYGIYHVSNKGECSWYDFTNKILQLTNNKTKVLPIDSEQLDKPAKRPSYSVLKNHMLEHVFNYKLRYWEDALEEFLQKL